MVDLTLRRFANEHNFILTNRYIYGKRENMLFSVFSTTFKFHIAAVGQAFTLKHKLQFSQHLIGRFGFRHGIRMKYICEDKILILSIGRSSGVRKINTIIDAICTFVEDKTIHQNSCFICTQPCTNEIIIDNHVVALAHDYCIDNMQNRLEHHSNVKNTHRGDYDKGAFAALIGASLGGIIWICLHLIFDYSWLLASLCGLTARDFYYLFKCRLGRRTRGIVCGYTAFAVFMSYLYILFFDLPSHGKSINFLNIIELAKTNHQYVLDAIILLILSMVGGVIGLLPTFFDKFEHAATAHRIDKRTKRAVKSSILFR